MTVLGQKTNLMTKTNLILRPTTFGRFKVSRVFLWGIVQFIESLLCGTQLDHPVSLLKAACPTRVFILLKLSSLLRQIFFSICRAVIFILPN